jgi:RNA polymerase sigma-70 factor (ECF subfamily)
MDRTTEREALRRREARLHGLFADGLAGDQAAYARFLTELAALLRGYFRNRLQRQPGDVEDLTQEVLLAVHNARHTYLPGQPLTAWVHAIARYKLADHFRAHARHDALNDSLDEARDVLAAPDLEPAQARRDLNLLLDQLPDRQRLPIVHVKLEGLSAKIRGRQ